MFEPLTQSVPARYIVVTSDEHAPPTLERGAWASRPEIRGDFEAAAEAVTDWCATYAQPGIVRVSTADTLDSPEPSPDRLLWLAKYFDEQLTYCSDYFYIQGQHDMAVRCPQTPWLSVVCPNPKMQYAHRRVISIAGRLCLFHDHTTGATLFEFLKSVEHQYPNIQNAILFAHQLWHPWLPSGRMYPSLKDIPPFISMVISGDYHVPLAERIATHHGHVVDCYSVGPFSPQDISEPGGNRFLVIDTKDWSVQSIPLPARPLFRYDLRDEQHLDQFVAEMSARSVKSPYSLDKPLIQVAYSTAIPGAIKTITEVCDGKAHLFPKPVVEAQGVNLLQLYRRNNYEDVIQCVEASGMAPAGTRVRKLVETVLDAKDKPTLFARLLELQGQKS